MANIYVDDEAAKEIKKAVFEKYKECSHGKLAEEVGTALKNRAKELRAGV